MQKKEKLPTRPVGSRKLQLGLWLVTHRLWLKKVLIGLLAGVSVGFYAYTLVLVVGLARGRDAYQQMMQDLARSASSDYAALRARMSAQPISVSSVMVLPSGRELSDLAVRVTNPNEKFAVLSLQYRFTSGGHVVAAGKSFLLPGESKYLVSFGVRGASAGTEVELTDVSWRRVRPDDYAKMHSERFRVAISDVKQVPGAAAGFGGRTSFTVVNNSLVGYWDLGLYVFLMNGEQLAAVNYARVRKLGAGEKTAVSLNWPQTLPPYAQITIVPEINLFDSAAFFPFRVPSAEPH